MTGLVDDMLILDTHADLSLEAARGRLHPPRPGEGLLRAFAAAAMAAAAALALAGAVILGPPAGHPAVTSALSGL